MLIGGDTHEREVQRGQRMSGVFGPQYKPDTCTEKEKERRKMARVGGPAVPPESPSQLTKDT